MRLILLFIFIGLNAFSQKIDVGVSKGYQNSSLDTIKGTFNVYYRNEIRSLDLESFEQTRDTIIYDADIGSNQNPLFNTVVNIHSKTYFVSAEGGLVYRLSGDTLERIDNSFMHEMQYGSAIFNHNDTIFKYGGYGFWSTRDFFTYFDQAQKEWDVLHTDNSRLIPEGITGGYYIKRGNDFFVFGGETINKFNRRERLKNDKVWHFDFKDGKWEFYGKHQPISKVLTSVQYDDKLLLLHDNMITEIDILANKISTFEHSPIAAQAFVIPRIGHYKGKFYLNIAKNDRISIYVIDPDNFVGRKISEGPFYKNTGYWLKLIGTYVLILTILISVFWLLKKVLRRRNKIILLDNGLRYKNKYTEFDVTSMSILKLLLAEKEVSSGDIIRLVEKEQYSHAHNERIKVQTISDINLKIATLIGIKYDVISSSKSEKDRRIREYKIDKSVFGI